MYDDGGYMIDVRVCVLFVFLLQNMVKSTDERGTDMLGRLSFMTHTNKGFMWDDDYASERLDRMAQVT